jgi:hypothetical protein
MSNYPLRLPDHVMVEARQLAEASGTSLNQFLSSLIAERVGELNAIAAVRTRAARADPALALAILGRVPDRAPLAGDELPGVQ